MERKAASQNKFIEKANTKFNSFFNYSRVEYIKSNLKVEIICPIHGSFLQSPSCHLDSLTGCPSCGKEKSSKSGRHNSETFISKASEIHNNFYSYDKVKYTKSSEKVVITCPIHGDFEQIASNHLKGMGCIKCRDEKAKVRKTSTTEQFIKKAQEIHNEQYDYSKVDYIKNTNKVIINCSIHGDFQQSPASHLRGSGCPECGKLKISAENGKDTEYFIKKAKEVHGDKYDYSLVEYAKSKNKVKIICPEHGIFKQAAGSHLYGNGCSKCASSKILPKSTEQFIEEAVKLHEDKYEYKNSIYLSSKEKIIITCPLHGDFQQLPTSHLQGSGCPKCGRIEAGGFSRTKFIERAKGRLCIFYTLKCFNENEEFYKIGITMLTVEDRYNTIVRMPYLYEVISEIHGEAGAIWDMEKGEKRKLKKFRYQPTIHFAGSKTECFTQYKVNETK